MGVCRIFLLGFGCGFGRLVDFWEFADFEVYKGRVVGGLFRSFIVWVWWVFLGIAGRVGLIWVGLLFEF